MSTPAYYRREATRCRELAEKSPSTDMATRWREMANEYEKLAESMEAIPQVTRPGLHASMQRQPLQQQQSRQEPEES